MQNRAIQTIDFTNYFKSKLKRSSVVLYYIKLYDLPPIPYEEENFAFNNSKFELGK